MTSPIASPDAKPYGNSQLVQALLGSTDPVHQLRGYGREAVEGQRLQKYRQDFSNANELAAVLARQQMTSDNFGKMIANADDLAGSGLHFMYSASPMLQGAYNPETMGLGANADMRGAAAMTADTFKTLGDGTDKFVGADLMPSAGMLTQLLQQGGMADAELSPYMRSDRQIAAQRAASGGGGGGGTKERPYDLKRTDSTTGMVTSESYPTREARTNIQMSESSRNLMIQHANNNVQYQISNGNRSGVVSAADFLRRADASGEIVGSIKESVGGSMIVNFANPESGETTRTITIKPVVPQQ